MRRIIFVLLVFALILIVGCESSASQPVKTIQIGDGVDECNELRKKLDNSVVAINNPAGRMDLLGTGDLEVGGTLINIENRGFSESIGYYGYTLRFRGNNKEGDLYLISDFSSIPYRVGEFYSFNFADKRVHGVLSGSFIEGSAPLTPVNC